MRLLGSYHHQGHQHTSLPPAAATDPASSSPIFFDNLRRLKKFPFLSSARSPLLLTGWRSRFGNQSHQYTSSADRPSLDCVGGGGVLHNRLIPSPTKSISALRNLFRKRKVTFSPPLLLRSSSTRARSPTQASIVSSRSGSPILAVMRSGPGSTSATGTGGMDWKQSISSDHTDIAYREAVSRLRSILSPRPSSAQARTTDIKENLEDTLPLSKPRSKDRFRQFFSPPRTTTTKTLNNVYNRPSRGHVPSTVDQDDLFDFIEKQSAYISQLEKEADHSRTDLGTVLAHVRQIISENETLHERQKQDLFTNMIRQLDDKTGGSVGGAGDKLGQQQSQLVRDSRVAELDAQLSQCKRALRAAQEEILELRRGGSIKTTAAGGAEDVNAAIEALTREKEDLVSTLTRLKEQISQQRDREAEATRKVKSSLEIVEQMQLEKAASDLETRRVKEELDRHQQRIRDLIQDHSRKLHEEKLQVEAKYKQELDALTGEMGQETDALTRARLDLERQKRVEMELRRELAQRVTGIEELRQELGIKVSHLQSELQLALTQKSHAEQELCMMRLGAEKAERDTRHEAGRLGAEVQALRKRSEENDEELRRSQDMVTKLSSDLRTMQQEQQAKARLRLEERGIAVPGTGTTPVVDDGGNLAGGDVMLISNMVQAMEDKHSRDMSELEQLVQVQNGLLDKLRAECTLLTEKLESTSAQYNKEKQAFDKEKERLIQQARSATSRCTEVQKSMKMYKEGHAQMKQRLHALETGDKTRSDRIFQLLSKQSGLLRENQSLQNEVAMLKTKIHAHARTLQLNEDEVGNRRESRRHRGIN